VGSPASSRFGFAFTLLYLVFEYARPQDHVSALAAIRPGLLLSAILVMLLSLNLHRVRIASVQTTLALLFLLLMALHTPFAENIGRAAEMTQGFVLNVIAFISIIAFVDTPERLRTLVRCWILLAIYIAINGILGKGSAGSSFLQDENDFAHLMNMMLPFGVFLFFYESNKKGKFLYLAASLLCLASIVASFSRGGFISLAVLALAIWLASSRKMLLLAVGAVALAVIVNLPITHKGTLIKGTTYWEEMTTIVKDDTEDFNKDSRVQYWLSAWRMFVDHPLGVGPHNFGVVLPKGYLPDYFNAHHTPEQMWGKSAHSIWFTLLPELGIPGLLLYLSLLLANVRAVLYLKTQRPAMSDWQRYVHFLSLAFLTSLVGFVVSGSFVSVLYYPHYWYLTAMIVATRKLVDQTDSSNSYNFKLRTPRGPAEESA
jgi:putative inorganic carbon (hco3(-)) transporter